jgi:hypothetical protein
MVIARPGTCAAADVNKSVLETTAATKKRKPQLLML